MARFIAGPRASLILPNGYRKPAQPVLDLTHPLNRGLVGYWPLGDNVVGNTADLSTYDNPGTFTGTPTFASAHHGGMATHFDGSTSDIQLPTAVPPSFSVSVCGWVNITSLPAAYAGLIMRNTSADNAWTIYLKSSGALAVYCGANTTPNHYDPGTITLSTGTWYFLSLTCDAQAGVVTGYVNVAVDSSFSIVIGVGGWLSTTSGFGLGYDPPNAGRVFNGAIADVRVYNRVISVSEMRRLYVEPYAGVYNARQYIDVGAAAAIIAAKGGTLPMMGVG